MPEFNVQGPAAVPGENVEVSDWTLQTGARMSCRKLILLSVNTVTDYYGEMFGASLVAACDTHTHGTLC
jgi:hypothetical protein